MTIATILKQKGADVAHVPPGATVAEVAHLLHARRIGAVLVMEAGMAVPDAVLGIVSERDIVARLAEHGASTLDMTAAEIMTRHLHTVGPDTSVVEAMGVMTARRVRHLPVMQGTTLIGLVSIGDVVKVRMDQQAHEVDSLKAYVAGA